MQLKNKYEKEYFEDLKPIPPEKIPSYKDLMKERGMDSTKVIDKPEIYTEQQKGNKMMLGWKTWVAGIGSILWGIIGAIVGVHSWTEVPNYILAGLAALGIGHKIEKTANNKL